MGVPALFRWISQRYPKITSQCVEEKPTIVDGLEIPVDASRPNPNGAEYDNVYLDMNGIIHPCCHPVDRPAPATEEQMLKDIFEYIDRILRIVRPRKLIYMAIDGVAPRAKMNQQRSRRFRAAQEAKLKQLEQARVRADLIAQGLPVSETPAAGDAFDSNCITPGTPFMANLAVALRYYVSHRLANDPGWSNVNVVLSDAAVPGEGEHKIMDYIRRQRSQPSYDPNTSHVLYGLDADLIVLALATHEPHFNILREDVFFRDASDMGCFICGNKGHKAAECTGMIASKDATTVKVADDKPYIFLHVPILREYLEIELRPSMQLPFKWDLERALDDWVLLVFFVGNDFLPHLPSLEIREGAIDVLVEIYKRLLPTMGGYMTESGEIFVDRVASVLEEVGKVEDSIFRQRKFKEDRRNDQQKQREKEQEERKRSKQNGEPRKGRSEPRNNESPLMTSQEKQYIRDAYDPLLHLTKLGDEVKNALAAKNFKALLDDPIKSPIAVSEVSKKGLGKSKNGVKAEECAEKLFSHKRKVDVVVAEDETVVKEEVKEGAIHIQFDDEDDVEGGDVVEGEKVEEDEDTATPEVEGAEEEEEDKEEGDGVRFWEDGWKDRYYGRKFHDTSAPLRLRYFFFFI